ncbi:hypothetical protein ACQ4PT_050402 [Festuca glaucescens]
MESRLDGGATSAFKLVVEVASARLENHESACVELNFNGQRHRTAVKENYQDERFYFDVSDPFSLQELALEAYVYDVDPSTSRTYSFLGKVTIHGTPFLPLPDARVMHYPLCCQPQKQGPQKQGRFSCTGTAKGRFSYTGTAGTLSLKVYTVGITTSMSAQEPRMASFHSAAASSMRLCVEVVTAVDLMPKEDQVFASAFVVLAFDSWKVRTSTKFKDVNPVWDESFYFSVPDQHAPLVLEASVYSVNMSLFGKVRVRPCVPPHFDPHVVYYPLEKNGVFSPYARGLLGLRLNITSNKASIRAQEPNIASLHSTAMRLCVEVVSAHDLPPKDDQGSASAFVVLTFDHCQFRTLVKEKDLNPVWNERFYFNVWDPSNLHMIDINAYVYHVVSSAKRSKTLLGKVRIDGALWGPFPDAILMHYPLAKHRIFSPVKGDLSLKVYTIYNPTITTQKPSPPNVPLSSTLERKLQKQCSRPHEIPLQHLKEITDNFSDDRILGQGGFGVVYKGVQRNGEVVAVKKIKSSFMPGMQRQFENEVCHLMMLKHPNVVRCKGYCYETRNECLEYNGKYVFAEIAERLLSLEYLPNGSLDKYISGGSYKPKVDNLKLVKVIVEGDPMSIPEIAECLKRIVPVENFQWEIYNFQNNVFRVKFPNKSEAQRMKTFRTYPVPDRASDLVFEDWSALEDSLYMLPEVWLRVRGIPADVRTDFLSLWAVGTLFGKTKEVDMVHTRKNKELRLRIGCLDHTLIPETTDVFIQRGFFKLSFEVEPLVVTQLDGVDMVNHGDNNVGGGNDGSNDDNMDGANDMDIEKTMNNQQQSNVNSKKSNVKKVNNAKGVVSQQVQHQVETPILFGSLNSVLLSKGMHANNILPDTLIDQHSSSHLNSAKICNLNDSVLLFHDDVEKDREGAAFQVDSALGSELILSAATPGSERVAAAGPALPLGSQSACGAAPLAAAPPSGVASPRVRRAGSPVSPLGHLPRSATGLAAEAAGGMPPTGAFGLAAAGHSHLPEKILPVQTAMLQVQPTVVGPATDRDSLQRPEQLGYAAFGFGSSAPRHSAAFSVASTKIKGINVVVDTQNSP